MAIKLCAKDGSARPWRKMPLVAGYDEIDTRGFVVPRIGQAGSELE
jgi:hypothetical protein